MKDPFAIAIAIIAGSAALNTFFIVASTVGEWILRRKKRKVILIVKDREEE